MLSSCQQPPTPGEIASLTISETAAALLALLGGAGQIPPAHQLKAIANAKGPQTTRPQASLIAELQADAVLACINASSITPTASQVGRAIENVTREIEEAIGCRLTLVPTAASSLPAMGGRRHG